MNKFSERKVILCERIQIAYFILYFILQAFTHLHTFTNPCKWVKGHETRGNAKFPTVGNSLLKFSLFSLLNLHWVGFITNL